MTARLYSIRMHASLAGSHISGAERITHKDEVGPVTASLVARAMSHERGCPDSVTVTVDELDVTKMVTLPALMVTDKRKSNFQDGLALALYELEAAGVTLVAASSSMGKLTSGASPDCGNMRGAMIVDAVTGARLEPDQLRGVRARAVDYAQGEMDMLAETVSTHGLYGTHFPEALALATKVASAPGIVAELCISDDPSYVTGYVSSPRNGYVRITPVKSDGDPAGGRAFFVNPEAFNMDAFIDYMRETPALVTGPFRIG